MEISREQHGDLLILQLNGRLDANWSEHVQRAIAGALHDGQHRLHLNMAEVKYVSSAGLRILLTSYKQFRAIQGLFGIIRPSEPVRSVLELAGMENLIAIETTASVGPAKGRAHSSASADFEIFTSDAAATGFRLSTVGQPGVLAQGAAAPTSELRRFGPQSFALGVGALGGTYEDCADRFGEFLSVAGLAGFQPSDGSSRPDFVVRQGELMPEGYLLLGLAGEGSFPLLARFEAKAESRIIGLAELAQAALELSGAPAAAWAAITETSGLVGASLKKSPALAAAGDARFGFPQIRQWLSFTSEHAFRDSTSLLVGVSARPGTSLDPLLRPLQAPGRRAETAPATPLLGHVHAAAFPYRPVRKGPIELGATAAELFEGQALQSVLHLLSDSREFNGAGESEFYRGALWIAPLTLP